jgi:hypothetical protein
VAQDFYAAFNVGPDDKHIATVDADGVALAAIQGLNQKVETGSQKSEARLQKLEADNARLKHELHELKELLMNTREQSSIPAARSPRRFRGKLSTFGAP